MRFALAGNPNCGKTTLFNNLTGSTAHVGNWSGVTVERKEGTYKGLSEPITIIDLPGIYSLSPYSPEEIVARNYIIDESPDVVINIVDATNLERNLYLTTQILETDSPVVVALNMMDIVEKEGDKLDVKKLESALGVPVVSISALKSSNISQLMEKAYAASKTRRPGKSILEKSFLGKGITKTEELLKNDNITKSVTFQAVKLLENDSIQQSKVSQKTQTEIEKIKNEIPVPEEFAGDFESAIADARYKYITANYKSVLEKSKKSGEMSTSDKIDSVLTHKFLGIPAFLLIMFFVFHLTFGSNLFFITGLETPGVMLQTLVGDLMGMFIDFVSGALESAGVSDVLYGLVVNGLLGGLDAVLSFIPQIMLLFVFLSLMEDSGYMARAAFIMDRLFRRFGLSGKAFMPMLMGFGCSVPAMMATRTLENEKDRKLTIMLMVGFSCGAKLPIWSLFAMALFPDNADTVVFAIYLLGILWALLSAVILKKTLLKGEAPPFIMELPNYHWPQLKSLVLHIWDKLKGYVVRAGTIIAASSIVIWFLANFSFSFQMVDENSVNSMLGIMGSVLVPIFKPLGFVAGAEGWKSIVAILTGLIAKEMVVATMGVLYTPSIGADALEDDGALAALFPVIAATFSPAAAFSFMVFNLLSVPCMAAVGAARAELRSAKWLTITIVFWLSSAYIVSFLVYNVGRLLGF